MKRKTLDQLSESKQKVVTEIPKSLHEDLKKAAAIDRRSMQGFIAQAIEERVAQFLSEDIQSRSFTPPGLR